MGIKWPPVGYETRKKLWNGNSTTRHGRIGPPRALLKFKAPPDVLSGIGRCGNDEVSKYSSCEDGFRR